MKDNNPPSPMSERWKRLEYLELEYAALKDDMTRLYDNNTELLNENIELRERLLKIKSVIPAITTLATFKGQNNGKG